MSLLCVFYNFNKRYNSTKTVDNTSITVSGNITLKMPTSLHNPTILFACGASDMPTAMTSNYCVFNNTSYWIRDIRLVSNTHIEFDCQIDVLATYKNQILLTKAYIMYSEKGSVELPDTRLGYTNDYLLKTWSVSTQNLVQEGSNLYYLLQVTGTSGLSDSYILSKSMMSTFANAICQPSFLEQIKEYFTYDPWTGINALYLTPVNLPNFTASREINISGYGTGVQGYPIDNDYTLTDNYEFTLNEHTDFRDSAIMTDWYLTLPFVGRVKLPSEILYHATELYIDMYIQVVTGAILYDVMYTYGTKTEALHTLAIYSGNCNSRTTISRTEMDMGSKITSTMAAIGSFVTLAVAPELSIPAQIGLGAASISSMTAELSASQSTTQMNGQISSSIGINAGRQIILQKIKKATIMNPSDITTTLGNPTCKCNTINNYTGYVQTIGFSLAANATAEDIGLVNQLMNNGVYIE